MGWKSDILDYLEDYSPRPTAEITFESSKPDHTNSLCVRTVGHTPCGWYLDTESDPNGFCCKIEITHLSGSKFAYRGPTCPESWYQGSLEDLERFVDTELKHLDATNVQGEMNSYIPW